MAGSALRSWLLVSALIGVAVLRAACVEGPGGDNPDGLDAAATLRALGEDVILPSLDAAAVAAEAARDAVQAWAEAPDDAAALAGARDAWAAAFVVWQRAEVMQVGPAGAAISALGGEDRRDGIYSWPTVNPCRVDQELVLGRWDDAAWLSETLVNVRGHDALEYLLHHPAGNACPPQVDINSDGTWAALGEDGVVASRAGYAGRLAAVLATDTAALAQRWAPAGGDFVSQLAEAGQPGSLYGSELEALNAVFDALFYVEVVTKDRKLAQPAGLLDCAAVSCPEALEAPFADLSKELIAANLDGFRALFDGGDGLGFDDLLVSIDQAPLNDAIHAALDAAEAAVATFDGTLADSLVQGPEDVVALHAALKALTDLLKNDLATALVLRLPGEAAGDND